MAHRVRAAERRSRITAGLDRLSENGANLAGNMR